jgi:hypothetical protein
MILILGVVKDYLVKQVCHNHTGEKPHGIVAYYHEMDNIRFCPERIQAVS